MATLLLDTNLVSYRMRRHSFAAVYEPHLYGHELAISFMTAAELLRGANFDLWGKARRSLLEDTLLQYKLIECSLDVCRHWADIRWETADQPLSPQDAWIAATARAKDLLLVTHDAAFRRVMGLRIITMLPSP